MQALEIDLPGTTSRSDHACNRSLRRYSLSMCLFQALVIVVLFYLLLVPGRVPYFFQVNEHNHVSKQNILIYTSNENVFRFVVSPIEGCNQRKHDIQQSVVCNSSRIEACRPVELRSNSSPLPLSLGDHSLPAIKITTSRAGSRLNSESIRLPISSCKPDLVEEGRCRFETTLLISPNITRQAILGWGGAMTDSTINTILSMTTNGTRRLLDDYFGQDGLRFNMVRITIGGSDFSSRFYTNDDSVEDDLKLKKFKLKEEDLLHKIPLIKLIQDEYNLPDRGTIKLFASMWSPPTWMKTNNHFNKGFLKGNISGDIFVQDNNEAYYDALSELKIKFIESYQRNSIQFWGLTVMNEPIFAVQPFLDFNTMIFPREDYGNYVKKYLGPKIRANPSMKHIKLMIHDDNRRFLEKFTLPLIPKLDTYIDGVSVHGYIDEAYDLMDVVYNALGKDRFIIPTELCSGHLPFMEKALIGNWNRGIHYALDIIHSLQHSAAGWVDWNMALDTTGGPGWLGGRLDAPIIIDKAQDLYHKSPMFYVLGQFSRYIPPGSVKVDTRLFNDQYDNHFETVTFKLSNENKFTTVIVNNNPYPIDLNLRLQDAKSIYRVTCEPDSVTTLIYPEY